MSGEENYCFDLVRKIDKDRFLATLFAPEKKRVHLLALYAFNAEIIRARDVVSEPAVGEIRLQWWLDALDAIYAGDLQDHPVAICLSHAITEYQLPKQALQNLVKAHIFDFYSDPMPTFDELEGYLGDTSSALIQLASLILVGEQALLHAEASGLAGVASGLAALLRNLPLQQSRNQFFIPQDMFSVADRPIDQTGSVGLPKLRAVEKLVKKARERIFEARVLRYTIKPNAMPAFLPVALTDLYLKQITKTGGQIFNQSVMVPQWRRQWTLWNAARRNTF